MRITKWWHVTWFAFFIFLFCETVFAGSVQYTYDNLNRLTKADYGNGNYINYSHDAVGNITGINSVIPTTSSTSTTTVPGGTTTTSIHACPSPNLNSPDGAHTVPLPVFSWENAGGVEWYNVNVWSAAANQYAASKWFDSTVCTGATCMAQLDAALSPGQYWWWLNTYSSGPCGFMVQPGGKYKGFTVVPCQGPTLLSPDGDVLASGVKPTFTFSASGAEWYNIMAWTGPGGGWLGLNIWVEAALYCTEGTCIVPCPKAFGLGTTWWWLNTYSTACGYQMQPSPPAGFLVN